MMRFATENLRKVSLISCFVGLVVSVTLFLVASQQAPLLIIILFIGWLSAPPFAFLLGHYFSKNGREITQRSLYLANILTTPLALAIYLYQTIWPRQTTPAFYWVAVPPAVVVIALIVVGISALTGSKRTDQTLM
jgi:hypothetical protein